MTKVKRSTAIARLRRDCQKSSQIFHISRSIAEENEFGECYVADASTMGMVQSGSLEEVMKDRHLLRSHEEIGNE